MPGPRSNTDSSAKFSARQVRMVTTRFSRGVFRIASIPLPRLQFVVLRQSSSTFHLADDPIKRAIGVLRRAEIAQTGVRFIGEAFQKCCREPRLCDTVA